MSIKNARKAIRKGVKVVIVQLIDEDEEQLHDADLLGRVKIKVDPDRSKKKDLMRTLQKRKDCFPHKIPSKLIPKRHTHLAIQV